MNLTPFEEQQLMEGFTRQFAIATRTKEEHLKNCEREWERCHKWLFGPGQGFANSCHALGLEPEAVREAARKKR